jgi:hypothetical protein
MGALPSPVTYWAPMRFLCLLAVAAAPLALAAAPAAPDPAAKGADAPVVSPARESFDTLVTATAPSGLTLSANLRDEYLAGLPMLVELRAGNVGTTPVTTPDLGQRPHLVHFVLTSPAGKKTERYSTPPAFDTGGDWTIAPKAERAVLLEVPSSAALELGAWRLEILVGDGEKAVVMPAQKFVVSPARPVAGDPLWESSISRKSGSLIPWVHQAAGGWDVYLNQYAAGDADRLLVHHRLFRSSERIAPVLSRTQASTARSRWLYWAGHAGELRTVRLEGGRVTGSVRSLGIPWATALPLARGVSDGAGGLSLPLWVPAPKGESGSVRMMTMSQRGQVEYRMVADFASKPPIAETGVDAAGRAVLVLAHDKGLDVYRVDPTREARFPVGGARAWKAGEGWNTVGVALDALPESEGRAGGLAVVAAQLLPGVETAGTQYRTLYTDLAGKLISSSAASPWNGPALLATLLPDGYKPFRYTATDTHGITLFGQAGAAPVAVGKLPPAVPWPSASGWRLRWIGSERVIEDRAVPVAQP